MVRGSRDLLVVGITTSQCPVCQPPPASWSRATGGVRALVVMRAPPPRGGADLTGPPLGKVAFSIDTLSTGHTNNATALNRLKFRCKDGW